MPGFTITFYLIRNFLKWTAIVSLVVIMLLLLFDFTELVRKASSKLDISFSLLIQMLFLKFPTLFRQIFPFVILFSSIITLWVMNRYQEMTIIKASGVSIWQILSPLILLVWVFGAVELAIFQPITSNMMLRYESMNDRYLRRNMNSLSVSETGLWIKEKIGLDRYIYHMTHINQAQEFGQNISVFQYNDQDQFLTRIAAEHGYFKENKLILHKVWKQTLGGTPEYTETLILPTTLSLNKIQNTTRDPDCISFWDLPKTAKILEYSGLSGRKYLLYWQALLARWIWLSVMILLGAACSLRSIRQQGTFALIGAGTLSAFLLYFLHDITYAFGNSGILPVILAAWTPVAISALLGITALLHFEEG